MKNFNIPKNPYLLFLPLFVLFIIIILINHSDKLWGDEGRYLRYADNLVHGFYSPPAPNINLTNGPGYPIILMPFVALHVPNIWMALLNAIFHYLSIVLIFLTVRKILSFRLALISALIWICYLNCYQFISVVISESFTIFLISLLIYSLFNAFDNNRPAGFKKYIYFSGIIFGYLVLTKIVFGYVLIFMLSGSVLLWLINRNSILMARTIFILVIALCTTSPYLLYTYHLTGKVFYWGTSGGNNLYWMSTVAEGEYGDWIEDPNLRPDTLKSYTTLIDFSNIDQDTLTKKWRIPASDQLILRNHKQDFEKIQNYSSLQQDDAFKSMAIRNMKSNPKSFVKNIFANIGRLLFDFPYSYKLQDLRALKGVPINAVIILLSIFCAIPTLLNWRKLHYPLRLLLIIIFLYLGATSLGSAETRMFNIVVPVLVIWILWILHKSVKLNLHFD